MKFDAFKEQVQKHPFYSFIIIAGAIIAFFANILSNIITIVSFVQKNPITSVILFIVVIIVAFIIVFSASHFQKRTLLRKIEKLITGISISMYQDTFGTPTRKIQNEEKKIRNYLFINAYFFLSVITDMDDTVQCFSVTIRDRTFNPAFKSPDYPINQPSFRIRLGVTKFCDIPGLPEYVVGCLGARTFSYYETRYLGNPGHYKDFGFGLNQAGCQPSNLAGYFKVFDTNSPFCPGTSSIIEQDLGTLKDFRTRAIVNSYAVSAPHMRIKEYAGSNLGVSYDEVRMLNI